MHHELAHTLYSHLAAIFGDHKPIAIELPAEQSDEDEPLREDSHSKSDGADSARTANIVEGKDVELQAGAAAENPEEPPYAPDGLSSLDRSQEMEQSGRERNACDPDRNRDHGRHLFELKTTKSPAAPRRLAFPISSISPVQTVQLTTLKTRETHRTRPMECRGEISRRRP